MRRARARTHETGIIKLKIGARKRRFSLTELKLDLTQVCASVMISNCIEIKNKQQFKQNNQSCNNALFFVFILHLQQNTIQRSFVGFKQVRGKVAAVWDGWHWLKWKITTHEIFKKQTK